MNRNEFMTKLEAQLADIPKEEREEALQYYRDYFEDAGAEHEMDVIRELGSPEQVAETIKADLKYDHHTDSGEYPVGGYTGNYTGEQKTEQKPPKTSMGLKILLIVLIVLVGAPVVIPVTLGLALAVLGIVFAAFAFFAGLVIGAAAVMFAGAVIVIVGIPLLITALPAGLLAIGSGLVTFVLGMIATVATVKLCIVMYPAIIRILVNVCRWPFYRRKAVG